jgi:hypothetical protein
MTKLHSPYGGSQVYRYAACPGSVALIERAPPAKDSVYSEEGTFAHKLAELCLEAGETSAKGRIGSVLKLDHVDSVKTVTAEMAAAVDVYLDAVWDEYGGDEQAEIEVEQRFTLDVEAAEGQAFGTNDALVYQPNRRKLTIFDYKHGAGVVVSVKNNHQLKFYAIGALQSHPDWQPREVELVVVQPRAFNAGDENGVKRWSMPLVDIIEYPYELNEAIKATKEPDAPLAPGDHCQFCPASIICPAREQQFVAAVHEDMRGVSLPEVADTIVDSSIGLPVDFEHMSRILDAWERLGPWVNDLRKALDEHLLAGGSVPGWKVVDKISRRKWVAADSDVADWLELMFGVPREEVCPPSLVTISEAKKLLKDYAGRERYADAEKALTLQFTIKESAGLTTAPESDKRPAVEPVAAEFGSVQLGSFEGVD